MKLRLILFLLPACLISITVKGQITPAKNIIGVDVSTFPQDASFNYDSCFTLGARLGMGTVGIFQNWTALETAPSAYNMTILDIANIYYPAYNMPVDLTLAPIHTNNLEVPADLKTKAFDDPVFIHRFKVLLDSIRKHIPNVTLGSLIIGSEHDVYLKANTTLWTQYTTFYDSVSTYAKKLWPGLKVATELTFSGITSQNTFAQKLNTNSDYIGVSYYPLKDDFTVKPVSTIPTDFSTLVGLYPSKPICFYQYGYPSSASCQSSDLLQAQFITQTFTTWDQYANHIRLIDFTWLHDLDMTAVNYYGTYYGVTNTAFLEFLRTLGLRTWNGRGTNKPAFTALMCETEQRHYNQLNTVCTTGIAETKSGQETISIFPIPTQDQLNIVTAFDLRQVEISIYNPLNQLVKKITNPDAQSLSIDTTGWAKGIYLVVLRSLGIPITRKVIIH